MTALSVLRLHVSRVLAVVMFSASLLWSLPGFAIKLEGDAAGAYTRYCSGAEQAVWVETFESGPMNGYIRLICLLEAEQDISYWWITPQKFVITDSQLPEVIDPPADRYSSALALILYSPSHPINVDRTATTPILLSFKTDDPSLPTLDFDYGSTGSATTGSNGQTSSTANFYVEGQEVDEDTYLAYESEARAAELEQSVERDRLIRLDAETKLYDVVDLNNWHEWLDVDSVNSKASNNACWLYKDALLVGLTRTQIKRVVATSEDIVGVNVYTKPVDGGDDTDLSDQISIESECQRINLTETESPLLSDNGGIIDTPNSGSDTPATDVDKTDAVIDDQEEMQFDDGNVVTEAIASGGSSSGSVNDALLFILAGMLLLRLAARQPKRVPVKQEQTKESKK